MSEEEINLLREILAELKANGEATQKFRAEVQQFTVSQHADWRNEAQRQATFRSSIVLMGCLTLSLCLLGLCLCLWLSQFFPR